MRPFLVAVFALLLAWAGSPVLAQSAIPELRARMTDTTSTLDAVVMARIDASLSALEAAKGAQVAVLMVSSTAPESIEAYAARAFEQFKLGRAGVDDGVLLVIAKDDRATRIEVGYGLEGVVPDLAARRVIDEYLLPKFREGDYAGGIGDATAMLAKLIDGEPLPASPGHPVWQKSQILGLGLALATVLGALTGAILHKAWAWLSLMATAGGTGAAGYWLAGVFETPPASVMWWCALMGVVTGLIGRESVRQGGGSSASSTGTSGGSSGGSSGSDWSGGGGSSGGGGASGRW